MILQGLRSIQFRNPLSGEDRLKQMRVRLLLTIVGFFVLYSVVAGRLVFLGLDQDAPSRAFRSATSDVAAARPDLLDRNGSVLATDIRTASLYADPLRIPDAEDAADTLATEFPELGSRLVRKRLASDARFIWLKRELTPEQRERVHQLGIPGIGFIPENKRFYPAGGATSHIVGHVNVDNQGQAGMEKFVDRDGLADLHQFGFAHGEQLDPVSLSVDLRVQHAVRDEIRAAMQRYQAVAGVGIVLDVQTGEVVSMVSMPDYDPNDRAQSLDATRLNRATGGVFEMGSVFKAFTVAMALDSGQVTLKDRFDARAPIRVASYTIDDFHAKRRILSVPEIFIYSSNIGTAKMALAVGTEAQKDFLRRLGLLTRMPSELPESEKPLLPSKWGQLSSITISFGHGLSVTPMQTAAAMAALVNGGHLMTPTFLPRTREKAMHKAVRVVSDATSERVRYLMRMNVLKGSGRRAEVKGYRVGGKTGTAEKIENGRYAKNKRRNTFLSAFPVDDPRYVVLVLLDEPKPENEKVSATAGRNAAPTVHNIIKRIAPMLGVKPKFDIPDPVMASFTPSQVHQSTGVKP